MSRHKDITLKLIRSFKTISGGTIILSGRQNNPPWINEKSVSLEQVLLLPCLLAYFFPPSLLHKKSWKLLNPDFGWEEKCPLAGVQLFFFRLNASGQLTIIADSSLVIAAGFSDIFVWTHCPDLFCPATSETAGNFDSPKFRPYWK